MPQLTTRPCSHDRAAGGASGAKRLLAATLFIYLFICPVALFNYLFIYLSYLFIYLSTCFAPLALTVQGRTKALRRKPLTAFF